MTCSIIHHGHIRLLKKASKYGNVIVSLTSDKDIIKYKKFRSLLNFKQRKEILSSIKYVSKVIKSKTVIKKKKIKHPRRAGKKTKSKSVWTVSGGLPSLGKRN